MIFYLKVHLICAVVALLLRFVMSIILGFNPINRIMVDHYKNLKEIIYTYGVILALGQKRIYSTRIDYSLKLPRLPFETIYSSFFEKLAFIQAFVLGPIQVLFEGLALIIGIAEYYSVKANFTEINIEEMKKEFSTREFSISKARNEEEALEMFAKLLISDICQVNIASENKSLTQKNIINYLSLHMDANEKPMKDAV